jgi:outer membrane biosynthesis protein TonB
MLHWQLKKLLRVTRVWITLFFVTTLFHLLLLFSLFFVYQSNIRYHFDINSTPSDVPIILVPFAKRVHATLPRAPVTHAPKKNSVPPATTTIKKEEKISKPEPVKQTLIQKEKKEPVKKVKAEPVKKETPPQVVPKKIEEVKKIQPLETKPLPLEEVQPMQVGTLELQELQMQEYINEQMAQHWHPPAGFDEQLECQLRLIINLQGKIKQIVIDKTSGTRAYDAAAQLAAVALEIPRWAYGKELSLTFKQ